MATRTAVLSHSWSGSPSDSWCSAAYAPLPRPAHSFRGDQLVEPAHFTLAGLQTELVQLPAVAVERPARAPDGFPEPFSALLDLTSPALQDSHPRFRGGAAEEGEVHAEPVVGVVLRTGVRDQLCEPLPALGVS